jgi:hypothetical protein
MKPPPEELKPSKEAPASKPTRYEEIRLVIEEYTNDLREIVKKLRRHMN